MNSGITAEQLMRKYSMSEHVENGSFVEKHYKYDGIDRPTSGSILYYVAPDERTKYHSIDCDEYWCYVKGTPLEIWMILPDGEVKIEKLGISEGCEPFIYLKKGVVFASKHSGMVSEGTILTCITVPRFCYEGFTMYDDEEILSRYPDTELFFE